MLPPSSSKLLPRRAGQATPPHFRRDQVYAKRFKRILDLTFITLALIVSGIFLVPVMAVITLLIAMDGGKPIYTQKRLGRGGRVYEIYKFRTMVRDAEAQLEKHLKANPEARAEWDAHQKLVVDPRITRIGRILRKTSLDELPQLLNVIKGDMSLVGPRPINARFMKARPISPCVRGSPARGKCRIATHRISRIVWDLMTNIIRT